MSDYSGRHQQRHHRLKAHNRLEVPTRDYQLPDAIGSWSPFDVTEYVRSLFANDPTMLPAAMRLSRLSLPPGGLDAVIDGSQVDTSTLELTDGLAPASSPTPTVTGGLGSLAVKWTAITNADAVGYEVHISTTTGFTPDATTRSQKIVGTLAYIRAMPDGTALNYATTYYVKLVAFDDDGSAPAGAQATGSPVQVNTADIAVNAITADTILANAITAAKLDTTLVLSSTIIAGTDGGARVELGVDQTDSNIVGLRAFDSAGSSTLTVDAQTGAVYTKGRFDFGSSRLLASDIIELNKQASSGFQTPARVQSANRSESNFGGSDFTSISCNWISPTTNGNLLFAVVTQMNSGGGSAPGTPTISGWTQIQTATVGTGPIVRQTLFKIESAAVHSGSETINLVSNTRYAAVEFFEYSGVGVIDITTSATTGSGTASTTSTTGTLNQAGELLLAAVSAPSTTPNTPNNSFAISGQAAAKHVTGSHPPVLVTDLGQGVAELITTSTSSTSTTFALGSSQISVAQLVTFKAAALAVAAPSTGLLRLYAKVDAAGTPTFHTQNSAGTENSLALAPAGAGWRFEYVTVSIDWPNTGAHTAATAQTPTVSGLAVGDLAFIIGRDGTGGQGFHVYAEPLCGTANQITVRGFNADSVANDPASATYHVLVIHRT